ncbi:MAG: hypothetical protein AAF669_05595, partial [Pseudomonadota bacterium]
LNQTISLLDCYYTRARRIAATYARFYLETEEGCDPAKKGRFYWMALGAFASKTVACLLDSWQVKRTFDTGRHLWDEELAVISEGLGLGNLWLFMDISAWHWLYANHPRHFFQGDRCANARDARTLPGNSDGTGVKKTVTETLEWADYALTRINDFKPTKYILQGMKLVEEIEAMSAGDEHRPDRQMDHLRAIAEHEQLAILQPLIYDHPIFAKWIRKQRENWLYNLISPTYQLVFSAGCETENTVLKSEAPDGMELEVAGSLEDAKQDNPQTRMGWIGQAADDFHGLMQTEKSYMERELHKIAAWVDEPDFSADCISVARVAGSFK